VTAHVSGELIDVEGCGRDLEACLERASIGEFDARMDFDQRLDVGEGWLAWIALL
jgi:hypothetical protein